MNNKSSLSANALFHFTEKEGLLGILGNGFYPRFCYENIHSLFSNGIKSKPDTAIPMVCFCDIPLSQMQYHMEHYGCYGIGLYKEWGMEKGINPVLYFHPNSYPASITNDFFISKIFSKPPVENKEEECFFQLTLLFKAYQGFRFKNGKPISYQCVNFYNEREWRYIPKECFSKESIKNDIVETDEKYNQMNEILKKEFILKFHPNDVKYIIIKKESERSEVIEFIQNIQQRESEKKILISKIISSEQILNDF